VALIVFQTGVGYVVYSGMFTKKMLTLLTHQVGRVETSMKVEMFTAIGFLIKETNGMKTAS
jgi:hypothetical protein